MKKFSLIFSFLLLFTFFFVCSTYAAAPEVPELPEITEERYYYVIYKKYNSEDIILSIVADNSNPAKNEYWNTQPTFKQASNGLKVTFSDNNSYYGFNSYEYKLNTTTNTWDFFAQKTHDGVGIYEFSHAMGVDNVYYSTMDIVNEDSTVFFPLTPLPQKSEELTVELMTAVEVPKMAEKITQTMKIIVLCGVGCLALLTGLSLFGKVFRIFQVK